MFAKVPKLLGLWKLRRPLTRLCGIVAVLTTGCSGGDRLDASRGATTDPSVASGPLRIAVASSLQEVLPVLDAAVRREFPEETEPPQWIFGATASLAAQLRAGAPYDVFFAADTATITALAEENVIAKDSVKIYGRGVLVLATAQGGIRAESLKDLTRADVIHVALANPATAPYGRAGQQAMQRAGVEDALQSKLIFADNVHQAAAMLTTGNAEAAFLAQSTADALKLPWSAIPQSGYDPLWANAGVIAESPRSALAQRWLDRITAPTSDIRTVWSQAGFLTP